MPKVRLSARALEFVMAMQPKHARQVLLRLVQLSSDTAPHDSSPLKGALAPFWRIDSGEYRIVYRVDEDEVLVAIIGKRNDDEVYKDLQRQIR